MRGERNMEKNTFSPVLKKVVLTLTTLLIFLPTASIAATVTITAVYVPGVISIDPLDPVWGQVPETVVSLDAAVIQVIGSPIMPGWRFLNVKAAHNSTDIFFNIKWNDSTADESIGDPTLFADAVALQVPYTFLMAPLEMGSQFQPVNIIFWRADLLQPQNIVAGGASTIQKSPDAASQNIVHSQNWHAGTWTVIISRPMLPASVNQVAFTRGVNYNIAFSNWEGGIEGERNGVKMITGNWQNLYIQ
jgi:DMSO reductase family type II enzyme heme b subunit